MPVHPDYTRRTYWRPSDPQAIAAHLPQWQSAHALRSTPLHSTPLHLAVTRGRVAPSRVSPRHPPTKLEPPATYVNGAAGPVRAPALSSVQQAHHINRVHNHHIHRAHPVRHSQVPIEYETAVGRWPFNCPCPPTSPFYRSFTRALRRGGAQQGHGRIIWVMPSRCRSAR